MPMVIVLSSFVAGSRVGGGVAQLALAPLKIDVALLPTVLLGRHPGWGAPGGGPVACETIAQMIDGVAANRLLDLADAVLIGYCRAWRMSPWPRT
jgi:Pyridoxal kinase (EC 2.7.1.35)